MHYPSTFSFVSTMARLLLSDCFIPFYDTYGGGPITIWFFGKAFDEVGKARPVSCCEKGVDDCLGSTGRRGYDDGKVARSGLVTGERYKPGVRSVVFLLNSNLPLLCIVVLYLVAT